MEPQRLGLALSLSLFLPVALTRTRRGPPSDGAMPGAHAAVRARQAWRAERGGGLTLTPILNSPLFLSEA